MMADVVVNQQGKCGYEDENGKLIVGYKYTYINSFNENGLALVMKGSKYGFINKMGVEVLPAIYDKITDFDHGVAQITKGKKVGLVDEKATVILKPTYLEIGKFNSQNITWATKDKSKYRYSILNLSGQEIIPVKGVLPLATLTTTRDLMQTDLKSLVGIATRYLVSVNTVFADQPEYLYLKKIKGNIDTLDTDNGYLMYSAMSFSKNIYYNIKGEVVFDENILKNIYQNIFATKSITNCAGLHFYTAIKNDIMLVSLNKYNAHDKTYTIANVYYDLVKQQIIKHYSFDVSSEYFSKLRNIASKLQLQSAFEQSIDNFFEEFDKLTENYIKQKSHIIAHPFNEGFARITLSDGNTKNDVVINKLGQEVARYKECSDYQDGRMIVKEQNDLYGVVDYQQQTIIPAIYKSISKPAGEFYAVLSYNGKCGTINIKNDTLVPIIYEKVQINADGITRAKTLDKWDIYHFDTLYYQCTDGVEPILYKKSLLLQYADNTVQVYDILTKKTSPIYSGCSDVLNAPSLHGGICYEVYQNSNGKKLYGYVNAHAEVVVPVVFERIDWAYRAYLEYKDSPAATFTEIDVYRLRLNHTLRERTYKLNSVIPTSDWDY